MNWIETSPEQGRTFRNTLGSFLTGVTVVAVQTAEGEVRAFTANSFASVSLEPALVLVCLLKSSPSLEHFTQAARYTISVLREEQQDVSNAFASRDPVAKALAAEQLMAKGQPYVKSALAVLSCEVANVINAGDHVILLGKVGKFASQDGSPLGFYRGAYVGVGPDVRELEELPAVNVVGLVSIENKIVLRRRRGQQAWTLPSAPLGKGEGHSLTLQKLLATVGLALETSVPYSLFQDLGETSTTFAFMVRVENHGAGLESGNTWETAAFGAADKPWELIEGPMKQDMLRRYFKELETGIYGLYFDTLEGGSVLSMERNHRRWDQWLNAH